MNEKVLGKYEKNYSSCKDTAIKIKLFHHPKKPFINRRETAKKPQKNCKETAKKWQNVKKLQRHYWKGKKYQ